MNPVSKLAGLLVALTIAFAAAPAHAQFGGDQMTQFAPMLEMMKQKMGKKRFGHLMQTMGPMMANMMGNEGGGGFGGGGFGGGMGGFSGGNFGGMANMFGSGGNMGGMMSMLGGQNLGGLMSMIGGFSGHGGRRGRASRHRHG
jgi:hypothetical protein